MVQCSFSTTISTIGCSVSDQVSIYGRDAGKVNLLKASSNIKSTTITCNNLCCNTGEQFACDEMEELRADDYSFGEADGPLYDRSIDISEDESMEGEVVPQRDPNNTEVLEEDIEFMMEMDDAYYRRHSSTYIGLTRTSGISRLGSVQPWINQFRIWDVNRQLEALDFLVGGMKDSQALYLHQRMMPRFQRDFISDLPREIALRILGYLYPEELLRIASTCKYWSVITSDNNLWREKCRERGLTRFFSYMRHKRDLDSIPKTIYYKTMYIMHMSMELMWKFKRVEHHEELNCHDNHTITCLEYSENRILTGSDDGTLNLWDADSSRLIHTLVGHTGGVWSTGMEGDTIVSGSTDKSLRVWIASSGQCSMILIGHLSTVRCLQLHNDIVVTGSRDHTLAIWDIRDCSLVRKLEGHTGSIRCVKFDGMLVISGSYDHTVKVWIAETGTCVHTLLGHTNRVYSLEYDGYSIISGSLDTTIRVWNVKSGLCIQVLFGHKATTSVLELTNNFLMSANADTTAKIWDIVDGCCIESLSGVNQHSKSVTGLQYIGKYIVTSSEDGSVKLWDFSTGEFLKNLVMLDHHNTGAVIFQMKASDTKLICAVGSRGGTESTKLLVYDFDGFTRGTPLELEN